MLIFETKLSAANCGLSSLYRWRCATCGRFGVWLSQYADVVRNASMHSRAHILQGRATP